MATDIAQAPTVWTAEWEQAYQLILRGKAHAARGDPSLQRKVNYLAQQGVVAGTPEAQARQRYHQELYQAERITERGEQGVLTKEGVMIEQKPTTEGFSQREILQPQNQKEQLKEYLIEQGSRPQYQGAVPEGYDQRYYRETGQLKIDPNIKARQVGWFSGIFPELNDKRKVRVTQYAETKFLKYYEKLPIEKKFQTTKKFFPEVISIGKIIPSKIRLRNVKISLGSLQGLQIPTTSIKEKVYAKDYSINSASLVKSGIFMPFIRTTPESLSFSMQYTPPKTSTKFIAQTKTVKGNTRVQVTSLTEVGEQKFIGLSQQTIKPIGKEYSVVGGRGVVLTSKQARTFQVAGLSKNLGKSRAVKELTKGNIRAKVSTKFGSGVETAYITRQQATITQKGINLPIGTPKVKITKEVTQIATRKGIKQVYTTTKATGAVKKINTNTFYYAGTDQPTVTRITNEGIKKIISDINIQGMIRGVKPPKNVGSNIGSKVQFTKAITKSSTAQANTLTQEAKVLYKPPTSLTPPKPTLTTPTVKTSTIKQKQIIIQKPSALQTSGTKTRSSYKISAAQINLTKNKLIPKIKVISSTNTKTNQKMITSPALKTGQMTQQSYKLAPKLITTPRQIAPTTPRPPRIPTPTPIIPIIPFIWRQKPTRTIIKFTKPAFKVRYGYTPSYTALTYGIRGPQPKQRWFKGFEIRPITKKWIRQIRF